MLADVSEWMRVHGESGTHWEGTKGSDDVKVVVAV